MSGENIYKRINTALAWEPGLDYNLNENGIVANINFLERLNDYNLLFNSLLTQPITEMIGKDGWAIQFIQISAFNASFFADIYVDNIENLSIIRNLMDKHMVPEITLTYYHKGKLSDYLHS